MSTTAVLAVAYKNAKLEYRARIHITGVDKLIGRYVRYIVNGALTLRI